MRKQKRYHTRLRGKVIEFLGGVCVKCGFSDYRALQIDHVDGGGFKDPNHGDGFLLRVLKNPKPYQLLCANCNWIKRHEKGENRGYLAK